ncbi:MAG TPA: sensor histidine kinase [Ktedonobacteraceae bacterium]|jgi:signal transduction histidine kinase
MIKQRRQRFISNFKAFRGSTLRRLRSTPSYFFLIWRWSMWIYALIIILGIDHDYKTKAVYATTVYLLIITFIQTIIVTLYAPALHMLFPLRKSRQAQLDNDETDILPPIARTQNPYWDIAVYGLDVIICGLVIYYSGPFANAPNFGVSSPFYRYGMSTIFAAALAYQYRGGLAAALGFELFIVLGILVPAPGSPSNPPYHPNVIDIMASMCDAPIIAILTGYIANLLKGLTNSKRTLQQNARTIQDSARRETYLRSIMETIVLLSQEKQQMLQKSIEQTRQGGHFHAVILSIPPELEKEEVAHALPTYLEATITGYKITAESKKILDEVSQTGQIYRRGFSQHDDTTRLYLPFLKNGHVHMILGAESKQVLSSRDEIFLTTVGTQLLVALENSHLAEQTVQLAAAAERGRLARELHDGVAQLVYMLSLNAETCAAQAQRIIEASEEDAELITPLAERIEKLVKITKQVLWETRTYMFTLKPLMSGNTTLTQMLVNQLQEFETISGLATHLEVVGSEEEMGEEPQPSQRKAQIGAAIFRIVQEALTNAYKHAKASNIHVRISITANSYDVEISDDGHGLSQTREIGELQRTYSGYGLQGMSERAQELEGSLDLCQSDEGGVRVRISLPKQARIGHTK